MDKLKDLVDQLNEKFVGKVSLSEDQQSLIVPANEIYVVLKAIKEAGAFNFLADLTAVDYPERFEVVYHLMNLEDAGLVRVKVFLAKDHPEIDSAVSLWKSADVMERETFDLMGIIFTGHPDLKRILCPDDFEGYPLRKDYKMGSAARQ